MIPFTIITQSVRNLLKKKLRLKLQLFNYFFSVVNIYMIVMKMQLICDYIAT
jgi:hypothetical protein